MNENTVIIRLHQGKIWFNETDSIPVENSNLPFGKISFEKLKNIYWILEQVSFEKNSHILTVNVLDYFLRETSPFPSQHPRLAIKSIFFSNLVDIISLKQVLKYYNEDMGQLDLAMEAGYHELHSKTEDQEDKISKKNILFRSSPDNELIKMEFNIWFKDAEFKLGYIAFEKNIPKLKKLLKFKVDNDYLLPEFEFIKSYFIKALGTRKFDVSAKIYLRQGKVTETRASSQLISTINESLIDSIKNIRTFNLSKVPVKVNIDKSLFTAEDIFGEFEEVDSGNIFSQSEMDILKEILEKHKVRNRRQLEYLAGAKQSANARLKFTLQPYFGFLFTIEGERMVHFIWELLNTHATYIWSLDKGEYSEKRQLRRVEDAINHVRNSGREQYKQAWRSSHLDEDLVFHVIHHEDVSSPLIDGFVRWRHRLEEILV